jgi:hypothetical protein
MSKYTIKLEQLVSSPTFGDLVLTIQYDFLGAKIISVQGEKITAELMAQINPVMNMVNFCLTKGISIQEVLEQTLVEKPSTPTEKLLDAVLGNLKTVPLRIQEVLQSDVIAIDSTILKHLR